MGNRNASLTEKMLRLAKRNGVEFTLVSWRSILKSLSNKKRYNACLSTYALFGNAIPLDQVVFSCLINAALDSNVPQEAAKMLRRYETMEPSSDIEYILFFRTYLALGDVDQAEATFDNVGLAMTPLMLNQLLLTCIKAKQLDRAERCLKKAHDLEQGQETQIVNIVSYNTLLKGYSQCGQVDRCYACVQEFMDHGLEPDDATVGTLVNVSLNENVPEVMCWLKTYLKESRQLGTTIMCSHFLKLFVKTDHLQDALVLYGKMKGSQTPPDIIIFSMLIKACVSAKAIDQALAILDDMIPTGCKPDDIILTHLLEGCRQTGKFALGVELFNRFVGLGIAPSDCTILTLLKLHGNAGDHNAAYDLVASCKERYGTNASIIHYTCLMSGALRSKKYDSAWQAYLLMQKQGVPPDATAITTLLPGMAASQDWDRVVELVAAALKIDPPLSLPAEMLNNALSQMIAAGAPENHTQRLQLMLQRAGYPVVARKRHTT